MGKRILTLLLTITIFYSNSCIAQDGEKVSFSKNTIHGSYGNVLVTHSIHINYDRLIISTDKGLFKAYYATLRAGGSLIIGFYSGGSRQFLASAGFTGLTGSGNHHLEFGLGLGIVNSKDFNDDDDDEFDNSNDSDTDIRLFPNFAIGYRSQTDEGLLFRTGVGLAEWFYVGVGFSF